MDPKPVEGEEQAKKRRGRKKSKLEDMFPAYLQVCRVSMAHFKHLYSRFGDVMFISKPLCCVNVIRCRRLSLERP